MGTKRCLINLRSAIKENVHEEDMGETGFNVCEGSKAKPTTGKKTCQRKPARGRAKQRVRGQKKDADGEADSEEVKRPNRGTCRRKDSKKTTTPSSTQQAEDRKTKQKGEGTNTPARGHTSTRSSTQHTRGAQQMCNTATLQTNKAQQPAQSMTQTTKGRGRK